MKNETVKTLSNEEIEEYVKMAEEVSILLTGRSFDYYTKIHIKGAYQAGFLSAVSSTKTTDKDKT